jgi:hypothetical protein
MSALNQRSDYLGQIKGMFEMLKDTHNSEEVAHQLLTDHLDRMLDTAAQSPDPNSLDKPLLLMTAYFIYRQSEHLLSNHFYSHLNTGFYRKRSENSPLHHLGASTTLH